MVVRKFGLFFAGIFSYNMAKEKEARLAFQLARALLTLLAQQKTAASLRGHSLSRGGVWRRRPPLEFYQFSRYASVPPPVASSPRPRRALAAPSPPAEATIEGAALSFEVIRTTGTVLKTIVQ